MPPHPPIDPEFAAALADPDLPPTSLWPEDIPDRRAAAVIDHDHLTRGGSVALIERVVPGAPGHQEIPVVVLSAAHAAHAADAAEAAGTEGGPQRGAPGILYIHGGGMVLGTRHHIDDTMLDAVELGYTVVSPEYRLAPEHPYPAAVDDCYAVWTWLTANAAAWGIDPDLLSIAGSSAGGGLAAGTTLLARDRGAPLPRRQILFCPMLDDRETTASSQELVGRARWDRIANRTGWSAYLGDARGGDDVAIYAAPARATELAGLPPTFIDLGDVETFRDEDIDFAARLSRAGVAVELHLWPGGVHGFTALAPGAGISLAALAARRGYLQRALPG